MLRELVRDLRDMTTMLTEPESYANMSHPLRLLRETEVSSASF